jgi:nitroreductase
VIQALSKATRSVPAFQGWPWDRSQAGFSGMVRARLAVRAGAPIKGPSYRFLNIHEAPVTIALPPAPQFGAPVDLTPAPEVLAFLATRRSTSALTLAAPAPSAQELDILLRLATRVPDHGKLSPWRFIVLEGDDKARFAAKLEALAQSRGDQTAAAKLAKLKIPPLAVAVISAPKPAAIPEWEQVLSAGAVGATLLYASLAMGYGANWITDWYAYDPQGNAILGLTEGERVAGFVLIGTPREPALERERPAVPALVSRWRDEGQA